MLVIGLLVVLALPRLGDLGDNHLKTACRHLAGTLQSVFDQAVFQKKTLGVLFDLSANTYQIIDSPEDRSEELVTTTGKPLPDKIRIKDVTTETRFLVTEGKVMTRFYPQGSADRTTIHLTNGQKDFTLILMPFSGKVRILEGYIETEEGEAS